jgi:hypothetical protein
LTCQEQSVTHPQNLLRRAVGKQQLSGSVGGDYGDIEGIESFRNNSFGQADSAQGGGGCFGKAMPWHRYLETMASAAAQGNLRATMKRLRGGLELSP